MYMMRGDDTMLWNSVSSWWSSPHFRSKTGTISVKFLTDEGIDEEGVDLGGPRREMFRLLMRSIITASKVFRGNI